MGAPTRRGILSAMAIAPVAIAAPAIADTSVAEQAFTEWKAIRCAINAATTDVYDEGDHPIWARLSDAEHAIRDSRETGTRVAEIRLWLSITGDLVYRAEHDAIHREDIDWLIANAEEPEFSTVMALRAIQALRGAA